MKLHEIVQNNPLWGGGEFTRSVGVLYKGVMQEAEVRNSQKVYYIIRKQPLVALKCINKFNWGTHYFGKNRPRTYLPRASLPRTTLIPDIFSKHIFKKDYSARNGVATGLDVLLAELKFQNLLVSIHQIVGAILKQYRDHC